MFKSITCCNFSFLTALAACSVLAVSGCDDSQTTPVSQGKSAPGNFLAAKYALNSGDFTTAISYSKKALAQNPDNPRLIQGLYNLMLLTGNYKEAITLASSHLKEYPDDFFASFIMTLDNFQKGNFAKASALLAKFKDIDASSNDMRLKLLVEPSLEIWSLVGEKKYDQALQELSKYYNSIEVDDFVLFQKAIINDLAGNIVTAKSFFDRLSKSPNNYYITSYMISFYHRNNYADKAQDVINEYYKNTQPLAGYRVEDDNFNNLNMSQLSPKDVAQSIVSVILCEIGTILQNSEQYDDATFYYRLSLFLDHKNDKSQVLLGKTLERRGLLNEALLAYNSVDPSSRYKRRMPQEIAEIYNKMGKIDQAKALLISDSASNPKYADALLALGDILVSNKNFEEAISFYEQAIVRLKAENKSLEINHWPILYALAICYEQSGNWEKAEKNFLKALDLSPNEPDVLNYLAYSWLIQNKNIKQAEEMLRIAVAQRPRDAHILDSYGWALFKLGKFDDALFFIEQANARIPYDPTTNDHLGDIYWMAKRQTEAVYMWKRALTFDPKPEDAQRIRLKIKHGPEDAAKLAAQSLSVKPVNIVQK